MRISDWSSDVCSSDLYGDGCDDCADGKEPIFGAGFTAKVNDIDGSESLTKLTITTTNECWPCDPNGLEMPLSPTADPPATNFMPGDRSGKRRAGKEGVGTCRSRGQLYH